MTELSRRKISLLAARQIAAGKQTAHLIREVAAYLIDSGRQREAELLARDIETALIKQGVVVGTVVSARPLSASARTDMEAFIKRHYTGSQKVLLREQIDASVIGGVRLELPDKQLDATIQTKLDKLTA
jgi:F0F1-type ATP synthase delta subunit